ncbi:MAG TPA: aspartate kinase [Anditalea sp.]|nr:aspartate kinase [Anditalea sp.]
MSKAFVFKFGGASIKDALAMKNLVIILNNRLRNDHIIVVSAIGKTTNELEIILQKKIEGKDYSLNITNLKCNHLGICQELFPEDHMVFAHINNTFLQLERVLAGHITAQDYDIKYDEVVSFGEIMATKIVQEYLCEQKLYCLWQDAREIIITDENHRSAKVNWAETEKNCKKILLPKMRKYPVITQGFIGRSEKGKTTTLGREGSDYTAAIIASCIDAGAVTIWKDVPGVLNADPKKFSDTILYPVLDYHQAAEMTYYGASVIHPKTIKPLANKNIPLWVKSFIEPNSHGTKITQSTIKPEIPTLIIKEDQVLVTFKVTDFTFINGIHLHMVYGHLNSLNLKVNLVQTSAISISICMDKDFFKLDKLLEAVKSDFQLKYNEGLRLLTILNYNSDLIDFYEQEKQILLEQKTRNSYQIVYISEKNSMD